MGMAAAVLLAVSCKDTVTFPDTPSPALPAVADAAADPWIGPEYKLTVKANLSDGEKLSSVRLINPGVGNRQADRA